MNKRIMVLGLEAHYKVDSKSKGPLCHFLIVGVRTLDNLSAPSASPSELTHQVPSHRLVAEVGRPKHSLNSELPSFPGVWRARRCHLSLRGTCENACWPLRLCSSRKCPTWLLACTSTCSTIKVGRLLGGCNVATGGVMHLAMRSEAILGIRRERFLHSGWNKAALACCAVVRNRRSAHFESSC